MKSRRGSTRSPISVLKISSASAASPTDTCSRVRVSGFMVVSHSWSAFISPNPLKRCTLMFLVRPSRDSSLTACSRSFSVLA
jgi:hypothetical protein